MPNQRDLELQQIPFALTTWLNANFGTRRNRAHWRNRRTIVGPDPGPYLGDLSSMRRSWFVNVPDVVDLDGTR